MDHGRTSDQVAALLESAWEQAERDNLQAAAEQVEAAHRTWEQHRGISASLVDHQRWRTSIRLYRPAGLVSIRRRSGIRTELPGPGPAGPRHADAEKPYYYNIL